MAKKDKQEKLDKLEEKMKEDNDLPLKEVANNLVFGEGNADADIMFIGEGPGYWEDKKARPFVGNAGAFLNQLITTMGMEREEVYITNVIHYRAPNNRDPSTEEIEAFRPYLDLMIEIIEPKVVVTLGRFSMAKFVPGVMISNVHGKPYVVDWKGKDIVVVPMYHPAAGLRSGEVKRRTIEDFKDLPQILEDYNKLVSKKSKGREKEVKQMNLV